jgi:RNA polymerase sigma-70 factor (ECF subfamily)
VSTIERLFETWYAQLVRSVRRRLGDGDEAEDVAQEAFVRLLDNSAPPRDAPAWLFGVTRNIAADRIRSAARRGRLAQVDARRTAPTVAQPDPEASVVRDEQLSAVRAVLAQLPSRDRQILLLHYDGLRYSEIAAHVGVAPSSIGSLLSRAHRRFLAAYDKSNTELRPPDERTSIRAWQSRDARSR